MGHPSTLHYKGFWAQNLGPGYIADAFRWARAADPGPCCSTTTTTSRRSVPATRRTTRPSSSTT
ncbi:hypothetical protein NKG94_21335 [Micromonospora sp. M12]